VQHAHWHARLGSLFTQQVKALRMIGGEAVVELVKPAPQRNGQAEKLPLAHWQGEVGSPEHLNRCRAYVGECELKDAVTQSDWLLQLGAVLELGITRVDAQCVRRRGNTIGSDQGDGIGPIARVGVLGILSI